MVQALLTRGTAVNANVHDGVTAFCGAWCTYEAQVSSGAAWHGLCSVPAHGPLEKRWR